MNRKDPLFGQAVREVMQATETPLELGWNILRKERQRQGVHLTDKELFLAGAGYLFDAMVYMLDPAKEPTDQDMALMQKIHDELSKFNEHFNTKFKE